MISLYHGSLGECIVIFLADSTCILEHCIMTYTMAQLSIHLAPPKSAGLATYRWLGVTRIHTHTCTCRLIHTHMGCMNTRDTMTVRFSGILYHTLGRKHLTGQGQNRTERMEKKGKQITSQVHASVQVRSYTSARRMRRRVRMTVRLSGLLEHPLERQ